MVISYRYANLTQMVNNLADIDKKVVLPQNDKDLRQQNRPTRFKEEEWRIA
jgi:hypothetical protein